MRNRAGSGSDTRRVRVGGGDVHLIDTGNGPELLLLHGNPDSSELWRPVIERLSARYRCLAPDLPGFGRSDTLDAFDGSLDAMADWVDHFLVSMNVNGPLFLAAHDFGGIFGLSWAIRYPGKVRAIAAGGFPFFPDYRWHFWGRVWRTPVLGELSMACMNRWLFSRELRRGGPGLSHDHISRSFALLTPPMKRTILRLYRATDPENFADWQEGLSELIAQTPLLVLWGERDPFVHPRYAGRFGAQRVHVFPDSGHWFPAEVPEATADRMAEFFGGLGREVT